uniref:SAC domain-containing protein n=1 Tax=Trichobilharzia regenti TaxID=157069 RepID=A0AA85KEU8_TRIRE|nr:unnamed protein product [Trichobilharzia regenti]CAH8849435.1 unnamed protein product [Trichobilharzia regenti]
MDIIETNTSYIIVNGSQALYCDRLSGKLTVRHASDVFNEWNPVCLGKVEGVIGKIRYHPDSDWRLYLINESKHVGKLPDGLEVRRISRVTILVLNTSPTGELNLNSCTRSHPDIPKKNKKSSSSSQSSPTRPFMKMMQKRILPTDTRNPKWRQIKRREKYEQRIEEELVNMLQSEDESYFYFSPGGGDLTNWTQRKTHPSYWNGVQVDVDGTNANNNVVVQPPDSPTLFKPTWRQPVWRRADQRFFWNFHLLSQPIAEADRMLTSCGFPVYGANFKSSESFTQFNSLITDLEGLLIPIVQGYVHIEEFVLNRLQGHLAVNIVQKSKNSVEKSNNELPSMTVTFFNNSVNMNDGEGQINISGLSEKFTNASDAGENKEGQFKPIIYPNIDANVRQLKEFDPSIFASSTTTTLVNANKHISFKETSETNDVANISHEKENTRNSCTIYDSVAEDTSDSLKTNTNNMTSSVVTVLSVDNSNDNNNIKNNNINNNFSQKEGKPMMIGDVEHVKVILFSRRSCRRAGTRYRRRGIDVDGYVANYVETEQILHTNIDDFPHTVAFLQCRGSVPLYWSQTSLVYNPPIMLEKTQEENQEAFNKYWLQHFHEFERILIVNLLSFGRKHRETILSDAYIRHILLSKNERLAYINFDFHDFCRNSQFQNASVLLSGIADLFRNFKYCWLTRNGMICEQKWIFHVNCLDCLDRTNLVQCMFAVVMITTQLKKIGLLGPEECLPTEFLRAIQHMWATNGDAISQIYAGTGAMKGDYTRTGSRTVNGLMRDGVYSVSRYYLRLREITRQAAIDLFIGNEQSSELTMFCDESGLESTSLQVREERIKLLIGRCQELLIQPNEKCFSECLLVSYSEFIRDMHYVNTVALVTDKCLHFIKTDFTDRNNRPAYIRIPLEAIEKLEFGLEPAIFRAKYFVLRIFYKPPDENSNQPSDSQSQPIVVGSECMNVNCQQTLASTNQEKRSQSSDLSLSPVKNVENIRSNNGRISRTDVVFGRMAHAFTTSFLTNDRDTEDSQYKLNLQGNRTMSEQNYSEVENKDVSSGGCAGGGGVGVGGAGAGGVGGGNNATGIRNFRQALKMPKVTHHFLEFLQPDTRLFNTVLVPVPPGDESVQALRVVASTILISLQSIGRHLELTETKPPNKLERLRQANIPKAYQPPVDLHTLGYGLRALGRRRESTVSLRSRHRTSRASSIQPAQLDTDDASADVMNKEDENARDETSFGGLNKNVIKQRLRQIKLPKLPFNFGRNTRSTSEQNRGKNLPIVAEKSNNAKQDRGEPDSEIADCAQFCSPKFKSKRNNNNPVFNGDDDYNYDDADEDDDDDLDEEDEATDNSDRIDGEDDVDLSDEDSLSEDNQSTIKIPILYPLFRRSTFHGAHEALQCKQAMSYSPSLKQAYSKQYSHSESDISKLLTSSTPVSFRDCMDDQQKRQLETISKSRKRLLKKSYQAISKSKLSLQLNRFPNVGQNDKAESTTPNKVTLQLPSHHLLTPNVTERQINLQTASLEELLYGIASLHGGDSGNTRTGSVSRLEKRSNDRGSGTVPTKSDSNSRVPNDQTIPLECLNNKIIFERLQQLFKEYTQPSIMNSLLVLSLSSLHSEFNNNPVNNSTIDSTASTTKTTDYTTTESFNKEFNSLVVIHDYGLYELLKHVYLPDIQLPKNAKLTEKLKRKQLYTLIQLDRIRRQLFCADKRPQQHTGVGEKYQLGQQKTIYSSFIIF